MIRIDAESLFRLLGDHGEHWIRGEYADNGKFSLYGAIRLCQPVLGDAYLIEQVDSHQGWGTTWEDVYTTTWQDIEARVRGGIEISDEDLRATFGAQWEAIVELVRRAAVLTAEEVRRLVAAWGTCWATSWAAAWDAVTLSPPMYDTWMLARSATSEATRAAARVHERASAPDHFDADWSLATEAAKDAAAALVVRSLIGQHQFTQEHYDTLSRPWRTVISRIHPEDSEAAEASR